MYFLPVITKAFEIILLQKCLKLDFDDAQLHNPVNSLYKVQLNQIREKLHQIQIWPEKNVGVINDTGMLIKISTNMIS